jgi:hypothetical protein
MTYLGLPMNGLNALTAYYGFDAIREQDVIKNGAYLSGPYDFFFNSYFGSFIDVIDAIMSGHPVLGSYPDGTLNHDVFITGLTYFHSGPHAGLNYAFYNSQTATYQYQSPNAFVNTFIITGVK